MTVALADAYRSIVITTGTGSGGVPGITTSTRPAGSFNLDAGFGISLVADPVNNKVTIVNTGNGTGALTTITNINTAGTYYPIFTRAGAPGDINPVAGTYQMDTMYLDQTTTPMTYAPSTSTLNLSNVEVTSTATLGNALVGQSSSANFTRFPSAQMVISNVLTNQQNETGNIGLIAEGKGGSSTYGAGVFGAGYSSGGLSGFGVIGNAHVTATGDIASAIAVRGYSNDTHAGGPNIALYGYAGNGSKNYALYMTGGDIYSDLAQIWTLADNDASALSIDATGKTGILKVITTNAGEGVTMSGTLSVTGHVTLEGVTSTGATGSGTLVFGTSPSISGTSTSITNVGTFALRDTSAAFDLTLAATSSTALTAGRTLTVDVVNAARTIKLAGNFDIANNLSTTGNFALTLTTTAATTATLPSGTVTLAANNQTFNLGTTSIAINRASASLALTGITSIDGYAAGLAGGNSSTLLGALPYQSAANTTTLLNPNTTATKKFLRMTGDGTNGTAPAWDTLVAGDIPAFNLGTTSITFNRASATQSLTGVNIDGSAGSATKATNLVGGNANTLLGAIGYQSAVDTTTLLSPNITTTKNFLAQTGDGTNGAAPVWTASTGTGSVVLATNPSITAPTSGNASQATDADATVDASTVEYFAYLQNTSGTARTINISNLTAGRKITLYLRNTNAATKVINITASTTSTGFTAVNLSKGDAGGASATAVTLAVTSGTATVTVFNANGTIGGSIG
jgi:hypothetical protein